MRRTNSGFTLLEVLLATLVLTTGLLGFAGTLGPMRALAGRGRIQSRVALVLASRISRLRTELMPGRPVASSRRQVRRCTRGDWPNRGIPRSRPILSSSPSSPAFLFRVASWPKPSSPGFHVPVPPWLHIGRPTGCSFDLRGAPHSDLALGWL